MTTNDSDWLFGFFFRITEESTTRHLKENLSNLDEDLELRKDLAKQAR